VRAELSPVSMICILLVALQAGIRAPAADAPPLRRTGELTATDMESARQQIDARFLHDDGSVDVEALVGHFEDLYRSRSSVASVEMTVARPRRERTLSMRVWTAGSDKALVLIEAPPREKGTATLKVDNNLWNYLPRIKRTIRIPPSMMLSPWMGSDLTNDDLVRESSYRDDYAYEIAGKSDTPAGWRIRFVAKAGVVGLWERFELVVSPDGTLPLCSEWYNRKGELARVMTWDRVRVMDGKPLPTRMVLLPQDRDAEGDRTTMVYREIDFDVDLPASTFSLSRLERQR